MCARGAGGHAACLGAPVPDHEPVDGRKLVGGALGRSAGCRQDACLHASGR